MDHLFEILERSALRFKDATAAQIQDGNGWRRLTYNQLHDSSELLARAFKAKGFGEGASIAILSENRPEWAIGFFSILRAGCVVVPIDKLLKKNEVQNILEKSETRAIVTSKNFLPVLAQIPLNIPVLCFDEGDSNISTLSKGIEEGAKAPALGQIVSKSDDTAVMIFTSGTTGDPKGVMLSHRNFLSDVQSFAKIFHAEFLHSQFLSILPLNHTFELTGGFLAPLLGGGTITYQDSLKPIQILEAMKKTGTEIMLTVPAFLSLLHHQILRQLSPGQKKKLDTALKLSSFFPFQFFRRWLFKEVHERFGGNLWCLVSGGAPLSGEIQDFFEKLGFVVLQGYGLTETSPVLTVNPLHRPRKNSVGRPIPGVEIKIDAPEGEKEGEILAKGENVMKGYYKNETATKEVMKDGYFCTGDIGYFDKDEYLHITGRLKNLIVSSSGKKIFPEEIEYKLQNLPYVKEVCVIGRKVASDEDVTAVVIPDRDKLVQDKVPHGEEKTILWEEIKKVNLIMAEYKRVKDLILWDGEFPKTTTMKVKRKELQQMLQAKLDGSLNL